MPHTTEIAEARRQAILKLLRGSSGRKFTAKEICQKLGINNNSCLCFSHQLVKMHSDLNSSFEASVGRRRKRFLFWAESSKK